MDIFATQSVTSLVGLVYIVTLLFLCDSSNDEIKSLIKLLWEHYRLEKPDVKSKPVVDDFTNLEDSKSIDAIVGYVEWLIEIDRKTPPFKQLQGLIWRAGYENGLIKGQ